MSTLDIVKCLDADCYNGFGWQATGLHYGPGHLVIAFISRMRDRHGEPIGGAIDEEALEARIRAATGATTVHVFDYLGRTVLSIYYTEWALIPAVVQAVLDTPSLCVGIRGHCVEFLHGERFSFDAIETKAVADLRQWRAGESSWYDLYGVRQTPHRYLNAWNWHTQAGKALCAEMRADPKLAALLPDADDRDRFAWPGYDELCRQHKVLHHGGWSGFVPSGATAAPPAGAAPLADTPSPPSKRAKSAAAPTSAVAAAPTVSVAPEPVAASADECMVCMAVAATTVVLPCMHQVACAACSRRLADTENRRRCIKCRAPISDVLYDAPPVDTD
jgi:Zinc finger, C3HC4 type (RING finger)